MYMCIYYNNKSAGQAVLITIKLKTALIGRYLNWHQTNFTLNSNIIFHYNIYLFNKYLLAVDYTV